jgi:hypothetical protein
MKIKLVLSQGAFWQINKELANKIGLESALLLSDLIDRESYFESRSMLISINGEGFFFVTGEQLEETTTLSYHKQRKCLKTLKDAGMIKTFLRGVPAKTHYKVVENKIWSYLTTSSKEIKEPVVKEFKNLLLKNSKTINNNTIIIIDNNNIDKREAVFKKNLTTFSNTYTSDLLENFFDYWSEKNKSGKKMKFELQKTFETSKRLATWFKRQEKWKKEKVSVKKKKTAAEEWRELLDTKKESSTFDNIINTNNE